MPFCQEQEQQEQTVKSILLETTIEISFCQTNSICSIAEGLAQQLVHYLKQI